MRSDLKTTLIHELKQNIQIVDDVIEIMEQRQGQFDFKFNESITSLVNNLKKELKDLPFSDIEVELLKVELSNRFKTVLTLLEAS